MPIPQELLKHLDETVDNLLKRRDSTSQDEPPRNPLDAPKQFLSDSPPQKVHGEGREDQDFWNRPPKPPIPLMRL